MLQLTSAIDALSFGPFSGELVTLMVVAMLITLVGFFKVVYFVSIGYAFSIAAMAGLSVIYFRETITVFSASHAALLAVYGLRLGIYLLARESKKSYKSSMQETYPENRGLHPAKKAAIWLGVSVLYVSMFSPAFFSFHIQRAEGAIRSPVAIGAAIGVMLIGLLIEAAADWQKSSYKKSNPTSFCNVGLYRQMRCPNYFGEIVFWTGSWLAGIQAYVSWWHWIFSLVGFVCIVLIMLGSTKRLEKSQYMRYGSSEEFKRYISTTPVLIPFVPIYTLEKWKVVLE